MVYAFPMSRRLLSDLQLSDRSLNEPPFLVRILRKRIFWKFTLFHAFLIALILLFYKFNHFGFSLLAWIGAIDLNDKTSNANNLTNSGVAEVTTSPPFAGSSTWGDWERTESDYMITGANTSLYPSTNKVTMEAWIKFESLPASNTTYQIFSRWYDTTNYYMLRIDNESGTYKINMYVSNGSSFDKFSYTWGSHATGIWYHVSGAWQGSDKAWEICLDGSSVATGTGTNVSAF